MDHVVQSVDPNTPQFVLPVVGGALDGGGVEGGVGYDGQPLHNTIGAVGIQQAQEYSHHAEVHMGIVVGEVVAIIAAATAVVALVKMIRGK